MLTILFLIFLFFIYDFDVLHFWKIIFLWNTSSMGDFKIYFNVSIFPSYLNWNVSYWTRETCISITDHLWSSRNVWYGSLKSK